MSHDAVKNPSHYQVFPGVESIQIIAASMSEEAFKGFCFGNLLKYRLRAGGKDDIAQEIGKANFYKELFESNKHLCRDTPLS